MSHVIGWFDIPDEDTDFVAYLAKSGDPWAFAWNVDPLRPEYPPAPVAKLFRVHGVAVTHAYQQTSARWAADLDAYWKDPNAVQPFRTTSPGRAQEIITACLAAGHRRNPRPGGSDRRKQAR